MSDARASSWPESNPGPALDLVAGALLAGFGEQRATRAILLGFDLPLWRLTYDVAARAPRALDPALYPAPVADELFDQWSERMDLALVIGVRPLLDKWEGVNGSRAADLARRLDAPVILVLDARGRGASAAAAVYGTRALASQLEIGGVVLVGGDDSAAGAELQEALRRDVGLPLLGQVPPQLTEQFLRQYAAASGSVRTLGGSRAPEADPGAALPRGRPPTCASTRSPPWPRGAAFCRSAPRRLLLAETSATDLVVAVAWGPPLQPVMLENVDVLQAMGVNLVPLNIARDRELPEPCDGLLFSGTLDEQSIDGVLRQRPAAPGAARRRRGRACPSWPSAAAPCSCCSAWPTAAGAVTTCWASCPPKPSCSSGTTGRATCAPKPPGPTPTTPGRSCCTSCSTSSSWCSSRTCSPTRSPCPTAAAAPRASSSAAAWRPPCSRASRPRRAWRGASSPRMRAARGRLK